MKKLIILIASACLIGLSGCAITISTDVAGKLDSSEKDYTYTSKKVDVDYEIENIEVNWPYGEVKCVEHDCDNVEFYEKSSKKITENNTLTYNYDSGSRTLVINYYNDNLRRGEIVRNKVLVIYVPKDKNFECVKMNGCKEKTEISNYVLLKVDSLFFDGELDIANYSK